MKFKRFTSLTNTYDEKTIRFIRDSGFDKGDWVVTEKLDGANFAFYYNGEDFRVASRNQFVDGNFFNCQQVINHHKENIIDWYSDNLNPGQVLVITGELIGDGIQGRVKYRHPEGMNRSFYAFDVTIDGEDLGYMWVFDNLDCVPVTPLIDICSFDKALEYNNTFKSYLSLIDLGGNNFSEGLSLSPKTPKYFSSGSRVWLKNKSPEFKEKSARVPAPKVELSLEDNKLLEDLLQFVNKNRVLSAISKSGEISHKDFGKVLGMVMQDVIEEFGQEYGVNPKNITSEWKTINSELRKEVSKEIREEFVKVL